MRYLSFNACWHLKDSWTFASFFSQLGFSDYPLTAV